MINFSPIPLRVILLIVAAGLLGVFIWSQGYSACEEKWEAKDAERIAIEQHAQIQQHILQRQAEQTQASQIAALDAQYQKDLSHAQTEIDKLRRGVRAGSIRLSVKSKPAAVIASDPAATSGADAAPRCELDPTTSDDLISIAADGDAAIRQLTRLQEYVLTIQKDSLCHSAT